MGIHFDQHPLLLIGLVVAAAAFTVWVYRHTVPPVAAWKRTILKIFRVMSLAILLLLLFKPVMSLFTQETDIPILAVLVDDSASMGLPESNGMRSEVVDNVLDDPVWAELDERYDIRYFAFSDSVRTWSHDQGDSLGFDGTGTNLSSAWQRVESGLREGNYAAAVILSDGNNNAGENPVRQAQYSTVPLFTVGIGDSTPARDAMVVQTITNEICYADDEVPLDVRVRGVGIQGETSVLTLLGPSGEDLGAEPVRWKDDFFEETIRFTFVPKEPGTWKYQVSLSNSLDEMTTDNNRKSFYIKVLESKVTVLILAGAPSFDLEFLIKALEKNPQVSYVLRTLNQHGDYYEGLFPSRDDMSGTDLIVFHHYPTATTKLGDLQRVMGAVTAHDIPVLFLMGPEVSLRKVDVVSEILPVRPVRFRGKTIEVSCTGAASHLIFEDDAGNPWVAWEKLPPLWAMPGVFSVKQGGQMISEALPATGNAPIPVVVVRKAGLRKSMAVCAWGLWKWGFQASLESSETLDTFLDRSIRYLVTREEDKLLRITTSKPIYQGGETVHFSAQVYNEDYQPVDGAEVEVRISAGDETVRLVLDGEGNGRYRGDLSAWTEGEYTFEGRAKRRGLLGEDRGKFTVEAFNIEYLNTAMNVSLLRTVAIQSGGEFHTPETVGELAEELQFPARTRTASWEIPVWNRAWLLWVLIGLLSLEWLIRKRSGML